MRLGTDDKRRVYTCISLFLIAALIVAWEILSASNKSSVTTAHLSRRAPDAPHHAAGIANYQNKVDVDQITFHTGQLVRIEQIEYSPAGRNIFSSESTAPPVEVPVPIVPARPAAPAPIVERPKAPTIDMTYLGYAQGNDRVNSAILMRGDENLMAKSGEVVFHHYEIGSIQPTSVQVTDLTNNNTQTINVTEK